MRGTALVLALGLLVQPAFAAALPVATGGVGAATQSTPRCTAAGLTVTPAFTGAAISSVTVGSVPVACANATLQAAVNNGATSSAGSATVPAGGGSVAVTLGAAVALTAGTQVDVVIVGP